MLVYVFCALWIMVPGAIVNRVNPKNSMILCAVPLLLLAILRARQIGYDTHAYVNMFIAITKSDNKADWGRPVEIGYTYFNILLAKITAEPQAIIAATSMVILIPILLFIYQFSKIYWLSIFLFVTAGHYLYSIDAIRQHMAFAIITIGFRYFIHRQFFKYVAVVLLASTLHSSILIFIPLYLVHYIKLNDKNYFLMICISFGLYIMYDQIIRVATLWNMPYSPYLQNPVTANGRTLVLCAMINIFCYYFIRINSKTSVNVNERIFFWFSALALIFNLFALKMYWFMRIGNMFNIYNVILIPNIINTIQDKNLRSFAILGWSVVGFTWFLLWMVYIRHDAYIPYKFFFEQ